MNRAALDFGVQSYCFRHFTDNRVVAAKVRECGLDKIELCGVHADFDRPDTFGEVVQIYREAGVAIVSLGVQTFGGEAHFKVESFPRAIEKVRAWSRDYGIRVGIHNHGGYCFGGQPDVINHLLTLGAPEIGLCLDTAWALQIGPRAGNPADWVRKFPQSIYGLHLKDFVFGRDGGWQDVIVGEGNVDLPGLLAALSQTGFDGMAVLEYEADPENPVPALRRCVESMCRAGA
jgi:sugar phosphate isomerase/epimerase